MDLQTYVLNNLVESGFISENCSSQILRLKENCLSQNSPFVVEISNPPESSSRYISVCVFWNPAMLASDR